MARQLSPIYRARRPTETVLYRVLAEHLGRFIDEVEAADRPLPMFVRHELEAFLACGQIEHGFVRQVCAACSFQRLIGIPCAGRGFCPSCLGRRMLEGAAQLVDHILPDVPVRHWVLSLPRPLRFALAYDNALCSNVLAVFIGEVFRWLRWTAKRELGLSSVAQARCGSFTAIHRSGSYLNANLHYHAGVLDGVYIGSDGEVPAFHALPAPTGDDILDISRRVYRRTRELFIALGRDWEQPELTEEPAMVQEPLLLDCAQASLRGVGLLGEQAGQALLPVGHPASLPIPAHLKAREQTGGFDLRATRRVSRGDRAGLERMCRYMLHPPLSHDRLQLTEAGRVRLRFSRPWRNGVDAMELEPLNLIARLVPLVPAPGTHRLRYHGVLAARAAHRRDIIPPRPPDGSQLKLFEARRSGKPSPSRPSSCASHASQTPKLKRIAWARLLKRMAGYEMEICPDCGARLAIVEVVLEAHQIERKLAARGALDAISPLDKSPARGPPTSQLVLDFSIAH